MIALSILIELNEVFRFFWSLSYSSIILTLLIPTYPFQVIPIINTEHFLDSDLIRLHVWLTFFVYGMDEFCKNNEKVKWHFIALQITCAENSRKFCRKLWKKTNIKKHVTYSYSKENQCLSLHKAFPKFFSEKHFKSKDAAANCYKSPQCPLSSHLGEGFIKTN